MVDNDFKKSDDFKRIIEKMGFKWTKIDDLEDEIRNLNHFIEKQNIEIRELSLENEKLKGMLIE